MRSAAYVRWVSALACCGSLIGCGTDAATPSANPASGGSHSGAGSANGGGAGVNNAGGSNTSGATAGGANTSGTSAAGSNAGGAGSGGASTGGSSGASGGGNAGNGRGGNGAGGNGAAAELDCTGRLVCDDFEKGATLGGKPGSPWKLRENDGTVTLDDKRAVSGKYSVKVAISATTADSTYRRALLNIDGAPLLPAANDKVFGRFMIWTDRIPDKSVHWTFAHGDGPYAQSGTTATYNYGGMGNLMANYYRDTKPDATDCWQTENENFPTGQWQCVGFSFDGANNEMHFWLGAAEVNEVHVLGNEKTDQTCTKKGVDGKWYAPTFKNISVGWESYQHDVAGAHDAWIDDVVLDDEPIACP